MDNRQRLYVYTVVIAVLLSADAQASEIPNNVRRDNEQHCTAEWTKRGVLDQRMYAYCLQQQTEGWLNLVALEERSRHYTWFAPLKELAVKNWTKGGVTNWRMVGYSLDQEVDAFTDIEYALKHNQFPKDLYEACFAKWQDHSSRWTIIRFCAKEGKPSQTMDTMYILSVPMQKDGPTSLAKMEKLIEQQQGHLQTAKGSGFIMAEWPDGTKVFIASPFSLASPGPELKFSCVRMNGGAQAFCEKLGQAFKK